MEKWIINVSQKKYAWYASISKLSYMCVTYRVPARNISLMRCDNLAMLKCNAIIEIYAVENNLEHGWVIEPDTIVPGTTSIRNQSDSCGTDAYNLRLLHYSSLSYNR